MVKVWYVAVVLKGQHSLGYIVAELHDLFFDIPKEDVTWPLADEHDCVHRAFSQVHGHCGTRSDGVGADFFLGDSQACFANGAYRIAEGIDHLPGHDVFDGAVGHVGGDVGVGWCTWVGYDTSDETCRKADGAKDWVTDCFLCDGIVLVLSLLVIKFDQDAVRKFEVRIGMWEDCAVFEESDVVHLEDFSLALFGLGDFEILAGLKGKENPKPC
jgi:hypothetical protein